MDEVTLTVFQREVEHQCSFALIAAEDMNHALQEMEHLGDELERRFEERARQEMNARGYSGSAVHEPILALISMQNELEDWWDRNHAVRARFWYSVQSLLMAAANVSKLLWPTYRSKVENLVPHRGEELRRSLAIGDKHSVLKPRTLRNHFEHYDVRLEQWAARSEQRSLHDLSMRSSGSADESGSATVGSNIDPGDQMRAFDADSNTVTFRGEAYQLQPIIDAVRDVRSKVKAETQKP